jgi:Sulfite oxidase and related enzymes
VFLATLAGGLTSLVWGKEVWGRASSVLSPLEALVPLVPSGGWRIYTVSGSMPTFDPATWKLSIGGLVEEQASFNYEQLRALPRVNQISTFHCVTGWTVKNVHWGGVRHEGRARAGAPAVEGARAPVHLGRDAVHRLPHDAAGVARRRDARVRDERYAAAARARRAAAADHPGDVRLQEREVAEAGSISSPPRARATGKTSVTTATRGSAARTATD